MFDDVQAQNPALFKKTNQNKRTTTKHIDFLWTLIFLYAVTRVLLKFISSFYVSVPGNACDNILW